MRWATHSSPSPAARRRHIPIFQCALMPRGCGPSTTPYSLPMLPSSAPGSASSRTMRSNRPFPTCLPVAGASRRDLQLRPSGTNRSIISVSEPPVLRQRSSWESPSCSGTSSRARSALPSSVGSTRTFSRRATAARGSKSTCPEMGATNRQAPGRQCVPSELE